MMNLHEVKDNPAEPVEDDYRVVEVRISLMLFGI